MKSLRFQSNWRKVKPLSAISLFFAITIIIFQNCGDARLTKVSASAPSVIGTQPAIKAVLAPPVAVTNFGRLVVIMDVSNSSIQGSCPDEVDDPRYAGDGSPSSPCGEGFDRGGDRFEWTKKWIQHLQNFPDYQNNPSPGEGFKVLLVPYAGGNEDRPRNVNDEPHMAGFEEPSKSLQYVDFLKQDQQEAIDTGKPLGTSFMYKGLSWAYDKMNLEFDRLGVNGRHTRWDVVVVGDGVRRPRPSDFKKFITPCTETGGVIAGYTDYMVNECPGWVNTVKSLIGDPVDNDPNKTWFKAQQLYDLARVRGFGKKVKMKLVQPHLEKIPQDLRLEIGNIPNLVANQDKINQIQYLKDRMQLPVSTSSSASQLPVQVGGESFYSKTYRIADFMVLNLNARVNQNGFLIVDSDADGVPDSEETASSSVNARTNGICLDGIEYKGYTCHTSGCDPTIDADGDGLNECEELSLGTSDLNPDSDGDGIPDLYEFLYDTNMYGPDIEADDNHDGVYDRDAFFHGVSAKANFPTVDPRYLIQTVFKELTSTGSKPRYNMQIQAVPLVQTRKVVIDTNPIWKGLGNPRIGISPAAMMGGIPHNANENEIVVVLRLVSSDPEESLFFIGRLEHVNYNQPAIPKIDPQIFNQVNY
jgi:hypothetical protein